MRISGPMWLGELCEEDFCLDMLEASDRTIAGGNRRLVETIGLVKGERGFPPGFYDVDKFCSKLGLPSKHLKVFLSRMKVAGFKAVRTHVNRRGFKTNASISEIEEVLKKTL
jgi:tRNA (guanine26-N2/guanine27-N2)-dimethyltransferase